MTNVVGEFPFGKANRAIRTPPNPMDKSTICSIYPFEINEVKPTIQPGQFHIEAGSLEKPSVLVVSASSWWKDTDEGQACLEIPVGSVNIADSIVKDYCSGLLEVKMGVQQPGIFFLPGEWSAEYFLKEKKSLILFHNVLQTRWYEALIKLADSLWARHSGNPLAIDDRMRMAARALKRDKVWIKDFQLTELIPCSACGHLRNPLFPVCMNCNRVVDIDLAKKIGISA